MHAALQVATPAATYGRVSTLHQANQVGGSLETQDEMLSPYVRLRGWNHEGHYEDAAMSGSTMDRPGLQAILSKIAEGRIKVVVVYKLDRLTRSLHDFLTLLRFFRDHGVTLISVTESLDTESPAGRMLVHVLMAFAEFERERTAERTRDKMYARADKGLWNGGRPPTGYVAPDGKLVPCPELAPAVRAIFRVYLDRRSAPLVRDYLDQHHPKVGGWNAGAIGAMLRNPVYKGYLRYGDRMVRGEHEPMVSESDWDRVQALLDENRVRRNAPNRDRSHELALAGVAVCACGSPMSVTFSYRRHKDGQRARYDYLRCKNWKQCKQSRQVNGAQLEADLMDLLRDACYSDDMLVQALTELDQMTSARKTEAAAGLLELEKKKLASERQAGAILRSLGDSDLSLVRAEIQKLEAERDAYAKSIEAMRAEVQADAARQMDPADLKGMLQDFTSFYQDATPKERRELFQCFFDRVEWHGTHIRAVLADGPTARVPAGVNRRLPARSRGGAGSQILARPRALVALQSTPSYALGREPEARRACRVPACGGRPGSTGLCREHRRAVEGSLSQDQRDEIVRLYRARRGSLREIGLRFGVSHVAVWKIIKAAKVA